MAHARRLETAITLAEGGQKTEAEALLRTLVAEGARHPKAAMALGVLCGERGDRAERRLWLQQARQLEEAEGAPHSLRLLLNLLVDALEQGEPEQALAYGKEALALYPEDGEVHLQVARSLLMLKKEEEAKHHLEQACEGLRARLAEDPADGKGWRLLALAEQSAERLDEAIEAYNRALALDPNHLPSLLAISRMLIARGQIDEGMVWLMNALANAPENPDVLSLNGSALKALGETNQAIGLFKKALEHQPDHLESSLSLGGCFYEQGLFGEAAQVFREALQTSPRDLECRSALAAALRSLGQASEAVEIYKQLLKEEPHAQGAFNNLMFSYSMTNLATPQEALATAEDYWRDQIVDAPCSEPRPLEIGKRPLRVGLLSADIGSHVVGRFLDPLLRHHDSNRCHLDLISMRRRYEASSHELVGLADGFHSLEGLPRQQARDLLRQQTYDLIVDTSGYTRGTGIHLLAERCAPVQAHYIGYHATTGLATIDWFIGDEETAAPELQDQFSEKLYRLPRPWLAYPDTSHFPEATPLMTTDQPVLGCFCQVGKITEDTLEYWGAIFKRLHAILVLKDRGLQDPIVREKLQISLSRHGIGAERIFFLAPVNDWQDHVDHYNIMDIALDTTPWSSATTGFEALGMGVPLIAIRGNRMVSRMSCSLVKGCGQPQWAVDSPEKAADLSQYLVSDLEDLRAGKSARQKKCQTTPIFDSKDLCKKFTEAMEDMFVRKIARL
jgi:protein O-GlcNAc transferase